MGIDTRDVRIEVSSKGFGVISADIGQRHVLVSGNTSIANKDVLGALAGAVNSSEPLKKEYDTHEPRVGAARAAAASMSGGVAVNSVILAAEASPSAVPSADSFVQSQNTRA